MRSQDAARQAKNPEMGDAHRPFRAGLLADLVVRLWFLSRAPKLLGQMLSYFLGQVEGRILETPRRGDTGIGFQEGLFEELAA